jgi:hypothetical protein
VKVLKEWKAKWSDTVSGLFSLSAGENLLFADACFELGIPLGVLLPMPQEQLKKTSTRRPGAKRALLAKVMEWRTLFKNQKFGK